MDKTKSLLSLWLITCSSVALTAYPVGKPTSQLPKLGRNTLQHIKNTPTDQQDKLAKYEGIKFPSLELKRNLSVPIGLKNELHKKTKGLFYGAMSQQLKNKEFFYVDPTRLFSMMDQITDLDHCVKTFYDFEGKIVVAKENEIVVESLVAKAVVHAGFISYQQRLDDLRQIHDQYKYWVQQRAHPNWYFLRKSPSKWVTGISQEDEIDENIAYLEQLQTYQYERLGEMAFHLRQFDQGFSRQELYQWIDKALLCINRLWEVDTITQDKIYDAKTLLNVVKEGLYKPYHSRKKVNDLIIDDVRMPNHVVRNWIPYAALAVTGIAAYGYYKQNPEKVMEAIGPEAIKEMGNGVAEAYNKYIAQPCGELWNVIRSQDSTDIKVSDQNVIPDKGDDLSEITNDIIENAGETERAFNEMVEILEKLKNTGTSQELTDQFIYEEVFRFFSEGNGSSVAGVDPEMVAIETAYSKNMLPFSKFFARVQGTPALHSPREEDYTLFAHVVLHCKVWVLEPPLKKLLYCSGLTIESCKEVVGSFKKVLEAQRLSFILWSIIPVWYSGLQICKGVGKAYNVVWGKKYDTLRAGLKHIQEVLVSSNGDFDMTTYGKLLFLLHQLKYEALRMVPKKYNMNDEFLNDVLRLESEALTIDQKKELIGNMRAYYPFLSPTAQ